MSINNDLPKIDHDFSSLTADSLQQAWQSEAKQQRWRKLSKIMATCFLLALASGLIALSWPSMRQKIDSLPNLLKSKLEYFKQSLKEWEASNEQMIIQGDILKK